MPVRKESRWLLVMNLLEAQEKTTVLQSSLYKASVDKPGRRFHALFDKIYREDVLLVAWEHVRVNRGAPGVDGVSIQSISERDINLYLGELAQELKEHRYKPKPARRVEIPKDNGKVRLLGIPTVRDRIVQAAAKLILEPIFEADFCEGSYGFRPGRGQIDALDNVRKNAEKGYRVVLDADIEGFFDHVDHEHVMEALRRRISDAWILRLIWRWLKAGVIVLNEREDTDEGTPQGGVISPLLANVYLHGVDKSFNEMRPKLGLITRFADDIVIQCGTQQYAERALEWLTAALAKRGLRLSEFKTKIVVDTEGFDFLGFHHRRLNPRRQKLSRWPSLKAQKKYRVRFRSVLYETGYCQTPDVFAQILGRLERFMRGWRGYFRHGQSSKVFQRLDFYSLERVARYKVRCQPKGKKRKRFSWMTVLVELAKSRVLRKLVSPKDWAPSNYRGKANIQWRAV